MSRGGSNWFTSASEFFPCIDQKSRSPEATTVEHAALRGLATTCRASVGGLPHARDEPPCRSPHAAAGDTPPGLRRGRETVDTWQACASRGRHLEACGAPATCVARAHLQALQARARATTCGAWLPWARRWRSRGPRRPWAFLLLAWSAGGSCARRRGRGRRRLAGYRAAQAPSPRARRAWGFPGLVRLPC